MLVKLKQRLSHEFHILCFLHGEDLVRVLLVDYQDYSNRFERQLLVIHGNLPLNINDALTLLTHFLSYY